MNELTAAAEAYDDAVLEVENAVFYKYII